MDFEWMEAIPALKKLKSNLYLRKRLGDMLAWLPKAGLVAKPPSRKPGISALMRVKNEARWIETTIRSLAPFVEQFSIVDNGSDDGTPDIVRRVCDELGVEYVLEILPTTDFGEVCDRALANTTRRWVLRWDGDMIACTTGEMTLAKLRDFIFSLDENVYHVIYFPHVRLEGDLFHQDTDYRIHYEDWLCSWSPRLYHKRTGRFREVVYPVYYKRLYVWDTYSFHIASLDTPEAMIRRKYWVEWRALNDTARYPSLDDYTREKMLAEYGVSSMEEAGALYCRERFRGLVRYDTARFGDYPVLMQPFLDTFPLRIVYRDGRIAGRTDIMDTLDRLDNDMRAITSVDVIISTRGRRDMVVETAERLLEQRYPHFRVIVVDQNDSPVEELERLADTHPNFIHHIAGSRGLPAGRNEGIGLSDADIILFVDDDIIPEAGLIDGHVLVYRDAAVGAVAGRVSETGRDMDKPSSPERIGKINYWMGWIHRGFTYDKPLDIETVQGVNMSFRRKVLVEAGGFDVSLGGAFLFEETDVCLTIREHGHIIRYTPDAGLIHLAAPSGGCRLEDARKQIYWYGHNFMLLFLKHFPRRAFPVWAAIRIAKFTRDMIRYRSPGLFIQGIKGMLDGWVRYRATRR